jgi:hypothetical protein
MSSLIKSVRGRRVWDSRGRPTVETEITLADGRTGRAMAPAGASTGSAEAVDRRDGGAAFGGYDVQGALAAVNGEIAGMLAGRDVDDQAGLDAALIALDGTPNKARLGGNAIVATSMAIAHAAAAAQGQPLWRYLGAGREDFFLPLPEVQIFGGGAHAGRRVDVQDFMVIAVGAADYAQALEWSAEVYRCCGRTDERGRSAGRRRRRRRLVAGLRQQRSGTGFPAARDRARRLHAGPGCGDFARHRRHRFRPQEANTPWRATGAASIPMAYRKCCSAGWCAIPSSPSKIRWPRTMPKACANSPPPPARRWKWSPTISSAPMPAASASSGCAGRLQHRADQAQPGRHALGSPRRAGCRAHGGMGEHRLGALGRNRGCDHRPSRRGLGREAAQGGLLRALRAHGEVERRSAPRRGAGSGRWTLAVTGKLSLGAQVKILSRRPRE